MWAWGDCKCRLDCCAGGESMGVFVEEMKREAGDVRVQVVKTRRGWPLIARN
jgi:hypothetical protein